METRCGKQHQEAVLMSCDIKPGLFPRLPQIAPVPQAQALKQRLKHRHHHHRSGRSRELFPKVVDGRDSFKRRASFHL